MNERPVDVIGLLDQVSANYIGERANRGVLAVAEEAGEFVGAYRRWSGQARRPGTFEEMADELADVVLAAWATAASLGINMPAAIERKASVVLGRIGDPR